MTDLGDTLVTKDKCEKHAHQKVLETCNQESLQIKPHKGICHEQHKQEAY